MRETWYLNMNCWEPLTVYTLDGYILPLLPNTPLFTQNVRIKKGESDSYAMLVQHVGKAELISWSYSRSVSYFYTCTHIAIPIVYKPALNHKCCCHSLEGVTYLANLESSLDISIISSTLLPIGANI